MHTMSARPDTHPAESDLSDLELLSSALQEAMDAHRAGLVLGPGVDEVALRRAERRARRADTDRVVRHD